MANTPQAIDRAHSTRNEKLAQAWREIVSRKATEAGWFPALALSSAASIRAFDAMTDQQFCCALRWKARTSRPNDTTREEVRALLVAKLSPVERTVLRVAEQLGWSGCGGGMTPLSDALSNHDRLILRDLENERAIRSHDFSAERGS